MPVSGAMQNGVLAGYNVVDVKVTLYDGSYHEVDSSDMAFKIAGSMAFKEAMRKADPVLTEPVMKVVTIVPEEYMGDVIGDFNSRRGGSTAWRQATAGVEEITAFVPLSNMFGYATDLRSKTQGRGIYSMEPSHFAEVPKSIQTRSSRHAARHRRDRIPAIFQVKQKNIITEDYYNGKGYIRAYQAPCQHWYHRSR